MTSDSLSWTILDSPGPVGGVHRWLRDQNKGPWKSRGDLPRYFKFFSGDVQLSESDVMKRRMAVRNPNVTKRIMILVDFGTFIHIYICFTSVYQECPTCRRPAAAAWFCPSLSSSSFPLLMLWNNIIILPTFQSSQINNSQRKNKYCCCWPITNPWSHSKICLLFGI